MNMPLSTSPLRLRNGHIQRSWRWCARARGRFQDRRPASVRRTLLVKGSNGIEAYNSDFTGIVTAVVEAYFPGIVEEFIGNFGDKFFVKMHQFFLMTLSRTFNRQPQALVVGCGGAGRAAAVAAAELGFATILMNRTPEKAQAIAETMPEYGFLPDPISDFKEAVKECDLVIYTLPMALPEIAEFAADDFAGEDSGQKKGDPGGEL